MFQNGWLEIVADLDGFCLDSLQALGLKKLQITRRIQPKNHKV